MKVGDWVAEAHCVGWMTNCQIAKIKYLYDGENEGFGDLVLYNHKGERVGRESEAFDGPKSFEPFCTMEHWVVIEKPKFPLTAHGFAEFLIPKNPTPGSDE